MPDKIVLPTDSHPMSDADYARAETICTWIRRIVEGRNDYIAANGLDMAINNPGANWSLDRSFFNGYRAIVDGDRKNLDYLRVFSSIFTGWFLGLRDNAGHSIPKSVPDSLVATAEGYIKEWLEDSTAPWWMLKYHCLVREVPVLGDLCLPRLGGECGLPTESGVLNFDTYSYAERLALLIRGGLIERLRKKGNPVILEIGSGFGALAYFVRKLIPTCTYICVDIPESLIFSANYLARSSGNILLTEPHTTVREIPGHDYVFVPNYMFHKFMESEMELDLAINTLSMSEMTPDQVSFYCHGLKTLLGKQGIFFEQNQDNRHLDLTYASEHIQNYFSQKEEYPYTLTNGKAALWSNGADDSVLPEASWRCVKPPYEPPVLVGTEGKYNLVRFQNDIYAVKHGCEVNWESDNPQSIEGVIAAESIQHATELIREAELAGPPRLVRSIENYNIVIFRKRFVAVPHGMAIDWDSRDVERQPGILAANTEAEIVRLVEHTILIAESVPRFLEVLDNHNLVLWRRRYFAVPHGVAIDWDRDDVSSLPGTLCGDSKEQIISLVEKVKKEAEIKAGRLPKLLQSEGLYNVVSYDGRYVIVRHGAPVDWEASISADCPGIYIEASLDDALAAAKNLTLADGTPTMIRTGEQHNVVLFQGRYFAIPHGVEVDWEKDSVIDLPGVQTLEPTDSRI